jgi:hypothetical protein
MSRIPDKYGITKDDVRTPAQWAVDTAVNVFVGYRYATDPFTRVVVDATRSRGVGGPSDIPTSTTAPGGKGRTARTAPGGKGRTARTNTKASWKPGGKGRTPCPKGHYWSYKKKKCVKSKFR